MTTPYTKPELVAALRTVQASVADLIASTPLEALTTGTREDWSAADYLKHLIISIKPVTKAIGMGEATLEQMFGTPDHASQNYDAVAAQYQSRLDDGMRAEDAGDSVVPWGYRFPKGVQVGDAASELAHLRTAWDDTLNKLYANLEAWTEEALDAHQLPHPAIGLQTLREMLLFTLFHSRLHAQDMHNAIARHTA